MNLILKQDGILAYIGTRSEHSDYLNDRINATEGASSRSWISLPGHTIQAMLGLCRNTDEAEAQSLRLYGSPLLVALTMVMAYCRLPREFRDSSRMGYKVPGWFFSEYSFDGTEDRYISIREARAAAARYLAR
jgi:hypothetical protein